EFHRPRKRGALRTPLPRKSSLKQQDAARPAIAINLVAQAARRRAPRVSDPSSSLAGFGRGAGDLLLAGDVDGGEVDRVDHEGRVEAAVRRRLCDDLAREGEEVARALDQQQGLDVL